MKLTTFAFFRSGTTIAIEFARRAVPIPLLVERSGCFAPKMRREDV
jgi:hypothetical protein